MVVIGAALLDRRHGEALAATRAPAKTSPLADPDSPAAQTLRSLLVFPVLVIGVGVAGFVLTGLTAGRAARRVDAVMATVALVGYAC